MLRTLVVVSAVAISWSCGVGAMGQDAVAKKAVVELRWLESKPIEGLTETEGFQTSCDPKDIAYPHKKPALVLTAAEVAAVTVENHDLSANGLSRENYMVTMDLTREAKSKLAASCEGGGTRYLTMVIDGHCWGTHRYEKGNNAAPEQCRAESFRPSVGMFSSQAAAQRVADAVR